MKLKWFETGTLVLAVIGYVLMFAGFAVAKNLVPETWFSMNSVSGNLAVCTFLLLACETAACGTVYVKSVWLRTVATAVLLFMFVSCQVPLVWYILTGNTEALTVFIKVVVPVLTMFVFLTAALYVTRQRRRMVYI